MKRSKIQFDPKGESRGVDTVVGYILALAITAALISLLIVSATGFVRTQQERVIRTEMGVTGQQFASDIESFDRVTRLYAGTAGSSNPSRTVDLPKKMAGAYYTLTIKNNGTNRYDLILRTNSPYVEQSFSFQSKTDVEPTTVRGGEIKIVYDVVNDKLVIENA